MKYNLLFVLFFICFLSQSQDKIDITHDSIANLFSQKAWDKYEIQSDSTLYYANKGIEYSKANNSSIGEVLNLEIKGIYFEEVKNDYATASQLYFKAIEIAEKKHPKLVSSLYNNLCIMYMVTDKSKSEFYGKKAVEASGIIKGTRDEVKAYVNLGIAQSRLEKYETANKTLNYFLSLKVLNQYERNLALLRIAKNYKNKELNLHYGKNRQHRIRRFPTFISTHGRCFRSTI
ncbi:hypothetical protein [Polaribacter sp.]|uniref:hypothetical protein n=1 Tax=Polaribacter sp. TaxID=1920175 RepID=UPI003F6D5E09